MQVVVCAFLSALNTFLNSLLHVSRQQRTFMC